MSHKVLSRSQSGWKRRLWNADKNSQPMLTGMYQNVSGKWAKRPSAAGRWQEDKSSGTWTRPGPSGQGEWQNTSVSGRWRRDERSGRWERPGAESLKIKVNPDLCRSKSVDRITGHFARPPVPKGIEVAHEETIAKEGAHALIPENREAS